MALLTKIIRHTVIPDFYAVRRSFADDGITDIPLAVVQALNASGLEQRLPAGGRIAIGVGSRGVAKLPLLVTATVAWFKDRGCCPFIVPCMGSHGGATSAGQVKILADLGVTEESAGCRIESSMEVVQIGQLPNGLPVYMDANAWGADGVFVINRVKPHTSFTGPNESGLVKMLTIGLGKQKGADAAHSYGNHLFATIMPAMTRMILAEKPSVLGGLGVVENELDKTCHVEAVLSENLERRDAELLIMAKNRLPSLPFSKMDFLLVGAIGKNISGAGMDPNITGRHGNARTGGPDVTRVCILRLTEASKGNATGMGSADIISRRMAEAINFEYTYANVITSTNLNFVRMPMVLETDEDVIRCGIKTCLGQPGSITGVYIRDTLTLDKMFVTKTAGELLKGREGFFISDEPSSMRFDENGSLDTNMWNVF